MNKVVWPLMSDPLSLSMRMKLAYFILKSKRFSYGARVEKFEDDWSKWLGSDNSLYVSSGSTANLLLIDAVKEFYNIPDQSKVLVPAVTWSTNINPIIQCNLNPVFVDVSLEDFAINPETFSEIYDFSPEEIKMIFVTHLIGYAADIVKIKKFFPNAVIVEDCCESHGCSKNNKKIGSSSIGCTFSFYIGHHMTTIEGGMISTNNNDLYHLMKTKRSHGMLRDFDDSKKDSFIKDYPDIDPTFFFITTGYNFRNHELPAYLGTLQLKELDKSIQIRNKNFILFAEILKEFDDYFYEIKYSEGMSSFCLPFLLKEKEHKISLEHSLKENGIEYRPIIGGNLLKHPFLEKYSKNYESSYPVSNLIHENGLYIGNNQFVTTKQVKSLRAILKNIF